MQRRALLACLAGGTALIAGCNTSASPTDPSDDLDSPTGQATVRPLDDPFVRHGLASGSERYLYARLFHPGDSLPVTDAQGASDYADAVDDLAENEFAVLTNLRTAAAAPAHFWPADARWKDERLRIELERQTKDPVDGADEAVGIALAAFETDGELPDGADIVLPSGATLSAGRDAER